MRCGGVDWVGYGMWCLLDSAGMTVSKVEFDFVAEIGVDSFRTLSDTYRLTSRPGG